MASEKIFKKLDELASNPKSKNFLNHLIKSYFPLSKINQVLNTPSKKFRCVITNAPLISVNDALEHIKSDEFHDWWKTTFMERLKYWVEGETLSDEPIKSILKGKIIGFTGENTDTFMSQEGYMAFYNWIIMKMLQGDKHINWIIKSMEREQFIKHAELLATDDESKKSLAQLKKSILKSNKRATTTLGDLDALKTLKAKLEVNKN